MVGILFYTILREELKFLLEKEVKLILFNFMDLSFPDRAFIAKTLKIDPNGFWDSLVISPASISLIEKDGEKLSIKAINIFDHQDELYVNEFYSGRIWDWNYI